MRWARLRWIARYGLTAAPEAGARKRNSWQLRPGYADPTHRISAARSSRRIGRLHDDVTSRKKFLFRQLLSPERSIRRDNATDRILKQGFRRMVWRRKDGGGNQQVRLSPLEKQMRKVLLRLEFDTQPRRLPGHQFQKWRHDGAQRVVRHDEADRSRGLFRHKGRGGNDSCLDAHDDIAQRRLKRGGQRRQFHGPPDLDEKRIVEIVAQPASALLIADCVMNISSAARLTLRTRISVSSATSRFRSRFLKRMQSHPWYSQYQYKSFIEAIL